MTKLYQHTRNGEGGWLRTRGMWTALFTLLVLAILFNPGLNVGSSISGQELEIKVSDLVLLGESFFLAISVLLSGTCPLSWSMKLVVLYFSMYFGGIFVYYLTTGINSFGPILFWGKQFEYFLICYFSYFVIVRNPYALDRILKRLWTLFLMSFFINILFITHQVITGQYQGIARAFERRASVLFDTAIGASGQFMILSFLFLIHMSGITEKPGRRSLVPLLFLGLIFSLAAIGSTSSVVSLSLVAIVVVVFINKRKILSATWRLVPVLAAGTFLLYVTRADIQHQVEYIQTRLLKLLHVVFEFSLADIGNRHLVWKGTFAKALEKPIFGAGTSSFPMIDNQFLKVLGEFGLVGFIVFMGVFVLLLRMYWRLSKSALPKSMRLFAQFMFLSTLILMFHGLSADIFQPTRIMEPYWLLTGVFLGMYSIMRNASGRVMAGTAGKNSFFH